MDCALKTVLLLAVLLAMPVRGAEHTAASASRADVQAKLDIAARGDTVLVPAGTVSYTSALNITKGVHLIGNGVGSTAITRGGIIVDIAPDATAIANEEEIEVTGFTMDGNDSAAETIKVWGAGASATKPYKNLNLHDMLLRDSQTSSSGNGVISIKGQVRGVIWNIRFDRCNVIVKVMGNDTTNEWNNVAFKNFSYGSADNLYVENCTNLYTSSYGGAVPGWIESGQGGRIVVRYCTWNMANATPDELWDIHGFQNMPSNGQTGTMLVEYYGNTILNAAFSRWINHRGSWGLFFNNIMTGSGNNSIHINQYQSGDAGGSGCSADTPLASGNFITEVTNTFVFNNTLGGVVKNMTEGTIGNGCGTAAGTHWTNVVSTGTSAPGGSPALRGAYWQASTTTATVDPEVIQNGVLWKCLSAGTWTAYYTPYEYPHPLRAEQGGGEGVGPSVTAMPLTAAQARGGRAF